MRVDTVEAIAEPSRRQILDQLLDGELNVTELVERLNMSQPAVSKHLRTLRDAGIVTVRPEGQRRVYRLNPESLMPLDDWLEPYRQMWRASLDRLETHLATQPTTSPRRRRQ